MDTATTTTTAATNAQSATMLVVLLVITLIATAIAVCGIITLWKLFTKAGKPGWAIFVPVYNLMTMGKIAEYPSWVGITAGVLSLLTGAFRPLLLVVLGFEIYLYVGMAKKYDAKAGFWVATILFPVISVFMIKNVNYKGASAMPGMPPQQPGNMMPPSMPQPPVPPQPPMSQPPAQPPMA